MCLKAEQAELEAEGIASTAIAYTSNQPVIDLCLGSANSIYTCMQEEAKLPGSSDTSLVRKLNSLSKHPSKAYSAARSERDLAFTVKHFAGKVCSPSYGLDPCKLHTLTFLCKVVYSVAGTLDKNRDILPDHIARCMVMAESLFVNDLFRAKRLSKGSFVVETKRRTCA
jgi:myosin heavy subunit